MFRVQAICRLGKDAATNIVNGRSVINFSAAYSEKYKTADGTEVNDTTWLNCSYWVEKTGIAQYLKKGSQVFLEGKPEARIYTNQNGQQVAQFSVRVSYIRLLGNSNNNEDQETQPSAAMPPAQNNKPQPPPISNDDMPF